MPKPLLLEAPDLPTAWKTMVPEYESAQYRPLIVQINKWDPQYAIKIREISERRSTNRINNYLDETELLRVFDKLQSKKEASIRFGVNKKGHGYHGERGDFCLIGGAIENHNAKGKANLTLFYRSLELIGGFAYDLTLIHHLGERLNTRWKRVNIMATGAHVFALKKNSNEKLYPKLWEIFSE